MLSKTGCYCINLLIGEALLFTQPKIVPCKSLKIDESFIDVCFSFFPPINFSDHSGRCLGNIFLDPINFLIFIHPVRCTCYFPVKFLIDMLFRIMSKPKLKTQTVIQSFFKVPVKPKRPGRKRKKQSKGGRKPRSIELRIDAEKQRNTLVAKPQASRCQSGC